MDLKRNLRAVPSIPAAERPGWGSPSPPAGRMAAVPTAKAAPGRNDRNEAGEAIDRLSRDIAQLRVEYERFFSGGVKLPPEELRNSVDRQFRQLRNVNLTTAVDNFRLAELEARHHSYTELFNRRLRDLEEGRRAPRPAALEPSPYDVQRGIVVAGPVAGAAAEALFQGLVAGGESPRFDLVTFHSYLERQAASIRDKTGCSQVQFRLASEDGKVKLKARPIGAPEGP